MKNNQKFADQMRELTATSGYRKVQSEMKKLVRSFSNKRFVYVSNPDNQTLERLREEGFEVNQTSVKEYNQYKISW